jgi:hypothetical protein
MKKVGKGKLSSANLILHIVAFVREEKHADLAPPDLQPDAPVQVKFAM